MKQATITLDLASIPIYLDGSDGSLWQSRDCWELMVSDQQLASKRFIRVSDLLELLTKHGIKYHNENP